MKAQCLECLYGFLLLFCGQQLLAQDSELTNYKSGISLMFEGKKNVDYVEEYLYFDKAVDDHKVVYIKDTTTIAMSHNELNIAGDPNGSDRYVKVGKDVGVIKFKPDGDQHWGKYPASWYSYSKPFDFRSLNYGLYGEATLPVVGTTGSNGVELNPSNKTIHYYRGIKDSIGEEWHTITVADDDAKYAKSVEYQSSDGKIYTFVLNPKAPALTWRVSGGGEFYTTPPKKYFIPKIYNQTTYISSQKNGDVTVEIRDIYNKAVSYRIVKEVSDATTQFINAQAPFVVVNDKNFPEGTSYLQYYCGNKSYIKTRIVVKNPEFPSKKENHGDRLWVNAEYWEKDVKPRLNGSKPNNFPNWLNNWGTKVHEGDRTFSGERTRGGGGEDALIARYYGMDRKRSGERLPNAFWAKKALFETFAILDPVGAELNHSNQPIPAREVFYRGYTDVNVMFSSLIAYDIIAGYYRTDQGYAEGLSPVQDYFIRDKFAGWVHTCSLFLAGYNSPEYGDFNSGGMWETSRNVSAALVTCIMPSYSSEYYGTSGYDGNTTTYKWAPFKDDQYTWTQMFVKNNLILTKPGMPNAHKRVGVEDYMIDHEGNFTDRPGYTSTTNMGNVLIIWWNLQKLFNGKDHDFSKAEAYLNRSATGRLFGLKSIKDSDKQPVTNLNAGAQNAWFPNFRKISQPIMIQNGTDGTNSWNKQTQQGGPLYVIWYDHDIPDTYLPLPPQRLRISEEKK